MIGVAIGLGAWWGLGLSRPANGQALSRLATGDFHAIAFDPTNADTLFFGHHQGMKVSHDGGKSWQDTVVSGVDAMEIGMPAGGSRRMYLAGHDIFVVSSDAGQSWDQPQTNLPDLDLHGFAVAPSDPMRLYAFAMGVSGLFTSADGGTTWEPRTLPPGMSMGMLPLAVAPDNPLRVVAGVGDQLAVSEDGAKTWQTQPGPGGEITAIAIAPTAPPVRYVGASGAIWQESPDGTWQRLPLTPDGAILALAVSPSQPARIAAVDQRGNFYRSDDGGQHWGS